MKLHLAACSERRAELDALAVALEQLGHTVTSRWLAGNRHEEDSEDARFDAQYGLTDILVADAVVLFTEGLNETASRRGGRHVEFGYALRAGKALFIVGPRENIFHELPEVACFADANELLNFLAPPEAREALS
jgi:hypothetical protein